MSFNFMLPILHSGGLKGKSSQTLICSRLKVSGICEGDVTIRIIFQIVRSKKLPKVKFMAQANSTGRGLEHFFSAEQRERNPRTHFLPFYSLLLKKDNLPACLEPRYDGLRCVAFLLGLGHGGRGGDLWLGWIFKHTTKTISQ